MRKGSFRDRTGPQRLRSISPAFLAAITPKPSLGDADEWLDIRTKRAAKTLADHKANMAKWVQGDTMVWGRDEDLDTLRDFALELKTEVEDGATSVVEDRRVQVTLDPEEVRKLCEAHMARAHTVERQHWARLEAAEARFQAQMLVPPKYDKAKIVQHIEEALAYEKRQRSFKWTGKAFVFKWMGKILNLIFMRGR